MTILRDPNSGRGQAVTQGSMAMVKAICQTVNEHANQVEKEAYSAVISKTPTGAGDCFFYIKNLDEDPLVISSLKLHSANAENIQIKLGDAGTVGGTHATLACVNRNAGSGHEANVTCESGVDITGLSGGEVVDELVSGTTMYRWEWLSGLIVPKNRILSLYAVTGAIAIKATAGFYFLCDCLEP